MKCASRARLGRLDKRVVRVGSDGTVELLGELVGRERGEGRLGGVAEFVEGVSCREEGLGIAGEQSEGQLGCACDSAADECGLPPRVELS